jgi:hypothetical protein
VNVEKVSCELLIGFSAIFSLHKESSFKMRPVLILNAKTLPGLNEGSGDRVLYLDMVAHYRAKQIVLAISFLVMLPWICYQMETAPRSLQPYPAPPFRLASSAGETISYPGEQGPALIVFSRPDDTLEEIELDLKALKYANENEARCWWIGTSGASHPPVAVKLAGQGYDLKGEILAKFPCREGDLAEWVVVDANGAVRWSGTRSPRDLKAKLTAL